MTKPAWREKPSWFLVAERDRMIAPETQRFMAHRAGSHILAMELDHTPLASAPDQVFATIAEAVDAVTRKGAFDPAENRTACMKIISVNVGLPREVLWKGITVRTGIFKEPVAGSVAIRKLNLAGDQQADLTVHGGSDKAVYVYPVEHYEYWRKQLPEFSFSWGAFGENLTTEGLSEDTLYVGDLLRAGSAILQVTQPRMPCYKLELRFNQNDLVKRFLVSGRSGFYLSVIEAGDVEVGSEVEVLDRDSNHVTVSDILRLHLGQEDDPELLQRAIKVSSLPKSWKAQLRLRAQEKS